MLVIGVQHHMLTMMIAMQAIGRCGAPAGAAQRTALLRTILCFGNYQLARWTDAEEQTETEAQARGTWRLRADVRPFPDVLANLELILRELSTLGLVNEVYAGHKGA